MIFTTIWCIGLTVYLIIPKRTKVSKSGETLEWVWSTHNILSIITIWVLYCKIP